MNGRVIAGAVLVLVVVVGAILLLVGSESGGDTDRGDRDTAPADPAAHAPVIAGTS